MAAPTNYVTVRAPGCRRAPVARSPCGAGVCRSVTLFGGWKRCTRDKGIIGRGTTQNLQNARATLIVPQRSSASQSSTLFFSSFSRDNTQESKATRGREALLDFQAMTSRKHWLLLLLLSAAASSSSALRPGE
ncbi:hypothetical protein THAOC_36122, partial [Thalassiosira oceanica]